MRFDGPTFARAWKAVSQASAAKDPAAVLTQTMLIEEYLHGVRLVATDRRTMLTAWVPDLAHMEGETEPSLDAAPDRSVVVHDADKTAAYITGLVLKVAKRLDPDRNLPPGQVEVRLDFDMRHPAGQSDPQPGFAGMDPTFVTIDSPDLEKTWLPVVEGVYPDWRKIALAFLPHPTKALVASPDVVSRVVAAGAWADGPLLLSFGGSEKAMAVLYPDSYPVVRGWLMPRRWEPLDSDQGGDEEPSERERRIAALAQQFARQGVRVTWASGGEAAEPEAADVDDGDVDDDDPGDSADVASHLPDAARLVTAVQSASAAMLRRKLNVDDATSRALIVALDQCGVIGRDAATGLSVVRMTAEEADAAFASYGGGETS